MTNNGELCCLRASVLNYVWLEEVGSTWHPAGFLDCMFGEIILQTPFATEDLCIELTCSPLMTTCIVREEKLKIQ
jgi:hypothetical protein